VRPKGPKPVFMRDYARNSPLKRGHVRKRRRSSPALGLKSAKVATLGDCDVILMEAGLRLSPPRRRTVLQMGFFSFRSATRYAAKGHGKLNTS